MNVTCTISAASISSFNAALQQANMRVYAAANTGMDQVVNQVYKQVHIPRITGALARSGSIAAQNETTTLTRTISFGNDVVNPITHEATRKYAVKVHEIYEPTHPESYKFLERAIRAYGKEQFIDNLAANIRNNIGGSAQ